MASIDVQKANQTLKNASPQEIVHWAIEHGMERAIVSTNFRPYEAVILHLCTQAKPDIPVLWVDHGYNRPATYTHMADLKKRLGLNIQAFIPRMTTAHRDALEGELPDPEDEEALKKFSTAFKLEPFQRGMRELNPSIWLTALRKVQNPNREGLDIVVADEGFGTTKVNPVFNWSDADMEKYLEDHDLPNEWDYWDPAKADEKRECGLHVSWGTAALEEQSSQRP